MNDNARQKFFINSIEHSINLTFQGHCQALKPDVSLLTCMNIWTLMLFNGFSSSIISLLTLFRLILAQKWPILVKYANFWYHFWTYLQKGTAEVNRIKII